MRGPFWAPITPLTGSFFHADPQIYTRFHDRSDLLMRLLRRKLELEESGLHEDVDAKDFRDAFCSVGMRILAFLISPERQAIAAVLAELSVVRTFGTTRGVD